MPHALEIEIKLAATPAMLEQLRGHPQLAGTDRTATLVTTYFDTSGGRLRRGGAALRIRSDGEKREQTLKLGSLHGRSVRRREWNGPAAGDLPRASGFPAGPGSALTRLLRGEPLEEVATSRIQRTTRRLHFGRSAIEIAFDLGRIEAGGREEPVCELELELVDGHLTDVIALALTLPLGPELGWSVNSKAERCHALAYDLPPAASRARPVRLSPAMDVAQGFQAIAWNCLEHLLDNYQLVITSGDREAVHQARVAIRRLRAAVSLFGDATLDESRPVLMAELKAVARSLGPARDLDVLFEQVKVARTEAEDLSDLVRHLGDRRDQAVASASTLLATETFQRLLFELAAWLEGGAWLSLRDGTAAGQPLLPFAASVLSRRRRKLRRLRGRMSDLSDEQRHRLRIDTKKLRYATAFFASLFQRKKAAKSHGAFARDLARLQDSLGELNDMAVAASGRDELFTDLEAISAAKHSAQLEGILASREKSRRKLLKAAEKALAKTVDAPAWWTAN